MTKNQQEFKKYLIFSPEQLRRLRGVDPLRAKLDSERQTLLGQAAKKHSTSADILKYQDAVRRHVTHAALEEQQPLALDIREPAVAASRDSGTQDTASGPGPGLVLDFDSFKPATSATPRHARKSKRGRHKATQTDSPPVKPKKKSKSKVKTTQGSWLVY